MIPRNIQELARSFPALRGAPIEPFDAKALDAWAMSGVSDTEVWAVQFVLSVYSPRATWACGHFDFMRAMKQWDDSNHQAFLTWAKDPWWP